MNLLNYVKLRWESFGAKIFSLLTLLIIVIYFSFSAYFAYYQGRMLKDHLLNEGEQFARLVAENSRLGVFTENKDLLKGPVEGILHSGEAMLVQIYASDGRQLESRSRPGMHNIKAPASEGVEFREQAINSIKRTKAVISLEGNGSMEFWAPVLSGESYSEAGLFFADEVAQPDNVIGFVRLVMPTEKLKKSLREVFLKSMFMPVFFLIPAWVIAFFIVKGITRPLKSLTKGVKALETSGTFETVPVETYDEVGRLATAFNDMAESLRKRESEKQALEEQLRHSQKMEAIGTFAGGIAHDFNNILTVIKSYGQMLSKKEMQDDEKRFLIQILSSAEKAAALTRSLLAFSRKQTIKPHPVNLNKIVRLVADILSRLLSDDIRFRVDLAEEDLIVVADTAHMENVLINLANNARDAMPEGGCLTITTKAVELDRRLVFFADDWRPGRYAMISVSDTGTGMDEKTKERIFDPFFTTKEVGKGTGLGLSMAYGIIKQHGGYINVASEPDNGATFNIYLPLSDSVIEEAPCEATAPMGGTETILLAEDDSDVRRLLTDVLERSGYRVIETGDGDEALEKFIAHKDEVQFLLLDIIMPGKNGKRVYEVIKKIRPGLRALFISGYSADVSFSKDEVEDDMQLLSKPISPDELLRKVRAMLDK